MVVVYRGCGMTQIGTGIKQFIAPVQTTDYYVRGEGKCNTTGCESVEVCSDTWIHVKRDSEI